MNRFETMGIMAILKEAYPMYYRDKSKEDLNVAVSLWLEMFADDDINLVKASIKSYIASDIKGYPPVIGQIKNSLFKLTEPEQLTDIQAWGLVSKAISNSCYNALEEFNKLPPVIQNTIGSSDRLREWSMVEIDTLQTVISSNFQRSFKVKAQNELEYKKIPNDIKALISRASLQLGGGTNE